MAIVGYSRVSTLDQNLDSQIDALKKAGAIQVFTDKSTGKKIARPGLEDCLKFLREGDVLLVTNTDRLGRSMTDLVRIVDELRSRGVQFKSINEPFDTTTAGGEMFFHVVAAFAQMNGRMITERTLAGLASARDRGRIGGRPTVMTPKKITEAIQMRDEKKTWAQIADALEVGETTVRRALL